MFARTQAVYTSRIADAFTGLQYCVEVVPQPLFLCQERELTQVPTQQKSSVFIIFQSNEKRESEMSMLHRSGMLGSKSQPSNHICTPGVSFYMLMAGMCCSSMAQLAAGVSNPVPTFSWLPFLGQLKEWELSSQPSSHASSQALGSSA